MTVGELTGFLSYVLQVMNSLMMISNVFLLLTRSLASARRIREVLEEVAGVRTALPERRSWRRIRLRLPSRPDVATRGILSGMTSTAYSFDAALDEGGCLRVRFAKDALRPHARFSQDAG